MPAVVFAHLFAAFWLLWAYLSLNPQVLGRIRRLIFRRPKHAARRRSTGKGGWGAELAGGWWLSGVF